MPVVRVPRAMRNGDTAHPEIQSKALVSLLFFSNLSAIIPPASDDVRPQIDKAAALSMAYSALKAGKFLPKNTGRKEETIIPPKLRRDEAIRVFLAVGREKIS